MVNTSNSQSLSKREVFYQRQRTKNRFFAQIATLFAEEAEREGITKRELARRLSCDPAQMTRWLTVPSNMTTEGISDALLSMGAEAVLNIVKFSNMPKPNYEHPLITASHTIVNSRTAESAGVVVESTFVTVNALTVPNWFGSRSYMYAEGGSTSTYISYNAVTGVQSGTYITGDATWQNQTNSVAPNKLSPFPASGTSNIGTSTQILTSSG